MTVLTAATRAVTWAQYGTLLEQVVNGVRGEVTSAAARKEHTMRPTTSQPASGIGQVPGSGARGRRARRGRGTAVAYLLAAATAAALAIDAVVHLQDAYF